MSFRKAIPILMDRNIEEFGTSQKTLLYWDDSSAALKEALASGSSRSPQIGGALMKKYLSFFRTLTPQPGFYFGCYFFSLTIKMLD